MVLNESKRHKTGLVLVLGVLLGFLMTSNLSWTDTKPQVPWVIGQAQLMDATVVSQHSQPGSAAKPNQLVIQYVYRFEWQHRHYVSHDLIKSSQSTADKLTSAEVRAQMLAEMLQAGQTIEIWINPDNPMQTKVKQPASLNIYKPAVVLIIFALLIWLTLSRRRN